MPRRLRNFDQSFLKTNWVNSLRGSPALGFGMTFFSGRQLTRLPTFTLTWPFLHLFFLAAESAGTAPNEASAAEGRAAGAAATSAPTQARTGETVEPHDTSDAKRSAPPAKRGNP